MTTSSEIEIVNDEAALCALEPEWRELWEQDPAATPFQSPAWLVPWARIFAGPDWLIGTMRRRGRLIAVLPLFLVEDVHGRRLMSMGAGISDYGDGVFDPEVRCEEVSGLIAVFRDWQAIELLQVPAKSPLLAASAPEGWSDERRPAEPCPVIPLPAVLSRRMRQNLGYYRRRIERTDIDHALASSGDEALSALESLFTLHGARWRSCGSPGVLADDMVRQFHRRAVPALADAGLLRMHVLHRRGTPVAVGYMLTAKTRAYDYITGFDPDLAVLGPGTVLIGCAIQAAMEEGAREFDFLRGREAYKYRWGARDQPTFARCLRSPRGH
jgi:CelD/BcsL family acetyltransferase involved in cellulose biosynthesis